MNDPKFEAKSEVFETVEDQEGAAKRYAEQVLDLPDEQCDFEVPVGTVLKSQNSGEYVEAKESAYLEVDERGSTNYDNNRRASYHGQIFSIKGKFGVAGK